MSSDNDSSLSTTTLSSSSTYSSSSDDFCTSRRRRRRQRHRRRYLRKQSPPLCDHRRRRRHKRRHKKRNKYDSFVLPNRAILYAVDSVLNDKWLHFDKENDCTFVEWLDHTLRKNGLNASIAIVRHIVPLRAICSTTTTTTTDDIPETTDETTVTTTTIPAINIDPNDKYPIFTVKRRTNWPAVIILMTVRGSALEKRLNCDGCVPLNLNDSYGSVRRHICRILECVNKHFVIDETATVVKTREEQSVVLQPSPPPSPNDCEDTDETFRLNIPIPQIRIINEIGDEVHDHDDDVNVEKDEYNNDVNANDTSFSKDDDDWIL